MDGFKEKHPEVFRQFATDEDSGETGMFRLQAGDIPFPVPEIFELPFPELAQIDDLQGVFQRRDP